MARIVWLASYPKSGNTWLRAFIYNLIEQPARPGRIAVLPDYFESESDPRWYAPLLGGKALEDCDAEEIFALRTAVHRQIASSRPDGTVFVKTHNQFGTYKQHPLHEMAVSSGAIYIVRNPLDVVLSTADHFGLGIDDAIEFMADDWTGTPSDMENVVSYLGSWSGHARSWSSLNHPQIIVLRYEDMLDKPLKAFGRVARLLGLGHDRERIRRAIRFSSFRELSKQEAAEGFVERSPTSRAFFRKGKKNQWVEALSDDQVARIVDRHRETMAQFRYIPPRYR